MCYNGEGEASIICSARHICVPSANIHEYNERRAQVSGRPLKLAYQMQDVCNTLRSFSTKLVIPFILERKKSRIFWKIYIPFNPKAFLAHCRWLLWCPAAEWDGKPCFMPSSELGILGANLWKTTQDVCHPPSRFQDISGVWVCGGRRVPLDLRLRTILFNERLQVRIQEIKHRWK